MKVKDFIKGEYDVDVYDDMCEELGICAACPITLTDEGEREFADVLNMEIDYTDGDCEAVVHVEDDDELERAKLFFYGAAGYIGVSKYDRWFREV